MDKVNCWEFKSCPDETRDICPAHPDRGLDCWKVTGTKCERGLIEMKTLEEKILHCRTCEYFVKHAHHF